MPRFCIHCKKEITADSKLGNWRKGNIQKVGRGGVDPKKFCCFECGMQYRWLKKEKTYLERYGVRNTCALAGVQEKIIQSVNTEECKIKRKSTCLQKYGVENPSQVDEIKKKKVETCLKNHGQQYGLCLDIAREKRNSQESKYHEYLTKKKNGTFNTSKDEKTILNLLKIKFGNVEYQYSSEKYPFNCDFYIPKLDLFIEYQGTWEHGKDKLTVLGSYDKNNIVHQQVLTKWIARANEFLTKAIKRNRYSNAIEIWTTRDPLKRKTAKENNLNWIEFFTIKEFMTWYEEQ